jgi:hypothetical protein
MTHKTGDQMSYGEVRIAVAEGNVALLDEIARLERERDALREALLAILSTTMMDRQNPDIWEPRVAKARAALEVKP